SLEIIYWNQAAQEMLGFDQNDTIGHPCYDVLQGLDEGNRLFCKAFCRITDAVSRREPVTNYDMQAITSKGDRQWLNMSVVAYSQGPEDEDTIIVHLFRDSTHNKDFEALFNRVLEAARNGDGLPAEPCVASEPTPPFNELTAREREVLFFLAEGFSTYNIAQRLVISPNTVRNHIQHILQKLHVHSRAEAVAGAIRHGFIQ
ncbi:MAG: PAS domain-containing protein, partial [Anaerolineaceae bacterium]